MIPLCVIAGQTVGPVYVWP